MAKSDLVKSEIHSKLARLRMSLRARLMGEGVAWLLIAVVGLVFVTFAFDYLLHLDRALRGTIMALSLASVGYVLFRFLVSPLRVPMDVESVALLIERHYGQLDDRLISAIQFSREEFSETQGSRAMIERMADEADRMARPLNFNEVVNSKGFWRMSGSSLVVLTILAGFVAWQGDLMGLWFRRNVLFANDPWPQSTYLKVLDGPDFTVVRGEDLTITVEVTKESSKIPPSVTLHADLPSVGRALLEMNPVAGSSRTFQKTFEAVSEEFEFYVTGGDDLRDRARPHRVRIVDPPALTHVEFTVEYPAYTGRGSRRITEKAGAGMLIAPLGSWVTITGRSTRDLKHARFLIECESLRKQRRLREDLLNAIARQADVCRKLDAIVESSSDGKVPPSAIAKLRQCAGLRGSVNRDLVRISTDQSAIVDELDKNPPLGGDNDVPMDLVSSRLIQPLVEIVAASKSLDDKLFESFGESEKAASGMLDRLASAAGAQKKLLVGMRAYAQQSEDTMRRVEAWMSEVPVRILPMQIDGEVVQRSVNGRVYLWGRNRSEAIMLRVEMTDTSDITNRAALECPIQVDPDLPPTVDLRKRGLGGTITPIAAIPLSIDVKDSNGINAVSVVYRTKKASTTDRPSSQPSLGVEKLDLARRGMDQLSMAHTLDLKGRSLAAGQFVSVWVEAFDTLPAEYGGPNMGRSSSQTFRIITVDEMFDSLIARQKQVRVEFEQAIYMQNRAVAKTSEVLQELAGGSITDDARRLLAESGSLQGTVNAECAKAADTLRAILEEMRNNRVGVIKDYDELENRQIRPIGKLIAPMTEVTAEINKGKSALKPDELRGQVASISQTQTVLLERMRTILKDMVKAQNRQELASKLKRLLRGWDELLNKTRKESDREKADRLENTTKPTTKPTQ